MGNPNSPTDKYTVNQNRKTGRWIVYNHTKARRAGGFRDYATKAEADAAMKAYQKG